MTTTTEPEAEPVPCPRLRAVEPSDPIEDRLARWERAQSALADEVSELRRLLVLAVALRRSA